MEDSIFIEILKHGEERGLDGTAFHVLKEHLIRKGFLKKDHDQLTENRLYKLYSECFDEYHTGPHGSRILKTDYYFRLIEYRELQEARNAPREANRNSFIAIGISILAILASVAATYLQMRNPVEIDDRQIDS